MARPLTVGLNGSAESTAAAHWAAREAQLRGLPLRLMYAWEWLPSHQDRAPDTGARQSWPERILNDAATDIESRYPGLPVSVGEIENLPVKALVAAALESELLVLGSRGVGGVHGYLTGSVSLGVVARAERPVVLVRATGTAAEAAGAARDDRREVVVGLDPRHPCEPLAEFAFEAAAVRGAPLRTVFAWHAPALYDYAAGGVDAESADTAERQERQELSAALRPWREKYPRIAVREQLVAGSPAEHLVAAAPDAALLVVGRRTQRTPMGTRLGPVAHAVLHHAPCPVAVVPHG
ncbi:universal stress protein [Streptantibioticus ferralitis]|uniref:Universal stress protein n=1 Tax=Streptantibioticus ferralitis TaxID=236510 RepID=A0ABT5YVU4_9ACTN|nr:universal stress protein [Streptantibioticus ferralitis]MDF2254955.1 universal stress protein [Streptantibioticus ferralitis]